MATWLPDWNSLDSVRHAHSDLEAVALLFFALLVVFDVLAHLSSEDKTRETRLEKIALCCFAVAVLAEIAAYPYGQRNDTLTERVIGSLDAKARNAFTNASNALTKAGEADTKSDVANTTSGKAQEKADAANRTSGQANRKAESAAQRTDELRAKESELEDDQRAIATAEAKTARDQLALQKLVDEDAKQLRQRGTPDDLMIAQLKGFPSLKVNIWYQDGAEETALFAGSIASLFPFVGWGNPQPKAIPSVVGTLQERFHDIARREVIFIRHTNESRSEKALWKALGLLNRSYGEEIDDSLPAETVEIFVGPQIVGLTR